MRLYLFAFCFALLTVSRLPLTAATPTATALVGQWRIDLARSTELSPWKSFDLTIALAGDTVTLERKLAWGRRDFTDRLVVDTARPDTVAPIDWWADNRHLGAYIGDDHTRRVHPQWLDAGRILRLSTDLVLSTQQGPRTVNVLTDFKVSASGEELTLTELRSTRNRPVVYVFKRLAAATK
ncbi:MAG: hypothetical protein NTV51_11930 [Verrucomicrobia bacterium]|nr:hypothetical protein [Verrucomicrobiota bacterium]